MSEPRAEHRWPRPDDVECLCECDLLPSTITRCSLPSLAAQVTPSANVVIWCILGYGDGASHLTARVRVTEDQHWRQLKISAVDTESKVSIHINLHNFSTGLGWFASQVNWQNVA